jgi:hypothetical protein
MGLFFNGIIGKLGNKERRYLHYSCGLADFMQMFGVEMTVVSSILRAFSLPRSTAMPGKGGV